MTAMQTPPRGGLLRTCLKALEREPLILFLILGAGVFLIDGLSMREGAAPEDRVIRITASDLARMDAAWSSQYARAPTQDEHEMMVADQIREEVLYREALRLGLQENDAIIRRRLAQKLSFLTEDLATLEPPTEDELRAHYDAHPEKWTRVPRTSFTHVYFSPERPEAQARAAEALAALTGDPSADPGAFGDAFMLSRSYAERTDRQIGELFGGQFAEALAELPRDRWAGPVRSALGWHLVRITGRLPAELPPFETVREAVEGSLLAARREDANRRMYEEMRARYTIEIASPDAAAPDPAPEAAP
ncbi:MAG: peptidyl-prolyl cis-trans isomerase [Alphaproteobacteria bacterium]|nr:peptidyl-prolyl cis-trans isomerase [Alphaproteobacteria bacterium]